MADRKSIKFHEYLPGDEDFEHYIDRLKYCFIANNIVTDEAKLANFYTICGRQVFETVLALITPRKSYEVSFGTIVELLTKHYKPKANEITMTYRFYSRNQQQEEKACDYITELRKIGAYCNFDNLERNLRDRLVCGMRDDKLKFDLLKKDFITYQEVVEAMKSAETAHQDVTLMRSTNEIPAAVCQNPVEPMDIGAVKDYTKGFKLRFCYRCGDKHSGICHHINSVCNFCHKKGHLEKICTQKRRTTARGLDKSVNGIYAVDKRGELSRVPPVEANIHMCGVVVKMQIDSGATYSIINTNTFYRLPDSTRKKLRPVNIHLSTWADTPVKLLGQLDVDIVYKGEKSDLRVIVAKGGGPNLLGRDWFEPLNIKINNVNIVIQNGQCEDLLQKYEKLFRPGLGTYRGEPVSIQLSPNAVPKFLKARPVPYALRERIEKEIDNMVTDGVLKPIPYSKWATPVVPIIKKDGSIRLCGDYRSTVNQATESDTYPMPTASEIFALLAGGQYFTTLDLDRAYTQVTVDNDTAKLLTINTSKGLFSVHRLAFGVKASPGIFQRIMTALLANIPGVAVLLDDIIVTGCNYTDMHERLDVVLHRIAEAGLRLNKNKCKFAKNRVEFLGFVIDAEGIHPAPSKIHAITNTPRPRNIQELQAFLGLYNFYERFVYHKATVLEPLHRLLDKKVPWRWTKTEQSAFDKAKNLLTSEITLTHYDTKKKLILTCDSSEFGIGVVLAHVLQNGEEKPIAMGSRTLHPHERRYSQLDKEATAILFGIQKFHNYLMGREFTIITDHQPLVGIFNPTKKMPDLLSPRLTRICLALSAHNYNIMYKPGKKIANADGLSRWPLPVVDKTATPELPGEILLIAETPHDLPFGSEQIAKETVKDRVLRQVTHYLMRGWPTQERDKDLHTYWLHRNELSLQDGCILLGTRVVVPPAMRATILNLLHQTHNGVVHTKALARSYVWWPHMDKNIEAMVASCNRCLENQKMPIKTFHQWITPTRPWSRIHIDFAGPFQNKYFLIVVDAYSKWPEVQIVTSMTSTTVIRHLRYMFAQHGLCETLVSDNGTSFVSKEFEEFLRSNKIKHITTAPYHPATNGQAERMVQTLKNKLKKMTDIPWDLKLPRILLTLRATPCETTHKSPAELLMNRQLRTLLDNIHPNSERHNKTENQIINNSNKKHRETNIGTKVMYRNYSEGAKWRPGKIIDIHNGENIHRHIDQLVKIKEKEGEMGQENMELTDMEIEEGNSDIDKDNTQGIEQEEIIEIPSADKWAEMLGIPTSSNTDEIGKMRRKTRVHTKSPYDKS